MAADLVRWFQLLCLDGTWAKAQPKALRWGLFHAPGRLVRSGRRHVVRILSGWPSADALLGAYRRLDLHRLNDPDSRQSAPTVDERVPNDLPVRNDHRN